MDIFDRLAYFNKYEAWGDWTKMNGALLISLDVIRGIVKFPFVVHAGYATSGHSSNSQHYTGNAVDFHVKTISPFIAYLKIIEALMEVQIDNYCGFGVYPIWNSPGFHLDLRGYPARWGYIYNKDEDKLMETSIEEAVSKLPL